MAKKFSLEAVLNLVDGVSAPMLGVEKKMLGFSKKMKRSFGGFGQDLQKASHAIDKAVVGIGVAAAAGTAAMGALVMSTADYADKMAKNARMMGMTAEELQALTYAADMQGVSAETLNGALGKMNKMMGEVKLGSSELGKYLVKNDMALYKQVRSAKNSEEAFTLLMGKLSTLPNEFAKAKFATLAFGKSGMELIKMSDAGADGISALIDEAHKYGLVTDEAAASSENWMDEMARFKAITEGLKNKVFSALIPKLSAVAEALRKMFFESANGVPFIDRLIESIGKIDIAKVVDDVVAFARGARDLVSSLIAVGKWLAPLAPYIIIVVAAIKVMTIVMGIFNAVAAANPVTLTILAIIAAIAAVIIIVKLLKDNWAAVTAFMSAAANGFIESIKTIGATILDVILSPLRLVLLVLSKIPGMAAKLAPVTGLLDGIHAQGAIGKAESGTSFFANPTTRGSESRTYAETRSTSEVFVRPDRGASISASRGGAPVPALSYGGRQ